jgi:beta-glucosidase
LRLRGGKTIAADFTVTNTGKHAGAEVAQIYALVPLPKGGERRRLIGWSKVELAAGETKQVRVTADPRLLAHFDEDATNWRIDKGTYRVEIGDSARDVKLSGSAKIAAGTLPP